MTSSFEDRLDSIAKDLKDEKTVDPVVIRRFMALAGVERRTRWNVDYIDRNLAARNLITVPNYKDVWVDEAINFVLIGENENPSKSAQENETTTSKIVLENPTFKIGDLPSAKRTPIFVPPTATLAEAATKMMSNDFSQLPVTQNLYQIRGMISWKSIGKHLVNGSKGEVSDLMEKPAYEIDSSASIFSAIGLIAENDYVLVRSDETGQISGIVTASDLVLQFEEISAPFLLISEIEIHIRNRIENMLPQSVAEPSTGEQAAVNNKKRTFGDYVRIMQDAENWKKLGLHVDQATFCNDLDQVRVIRNNVMHFSVDGPQKEDITRLQGIAKMLEFLRNV